MSDVWVLGASMTKIGRYPDKDLIDLAVGGGVDALADGGVTMQDMDVMGVGNMFQAMAGIGQSVQQQIGQTGIPVYNVVERVRDRRDRGAHRVPHHHGRRGRHGSRDRARADGQDGSARARRAGQERAPRLRAERSVRIASRASRASSAPTLMPGVFAQAGQEYAYEHDGVGFEQFAKVAEKNHAHSTLNPLAQYQKEFSLEEIMNARMIAYPNTLPMCCPTGDGAVVGGARARARSSRRSRPSSASVRSRSARRCSPPTRGPRAVKRSPTSTRSRAMRPTQAYEKAGVGPEGPRPRGAARLLRHGRARALRQPGPLRAGRRRRVHRLGRTVARRHARR